MKRRPVILLSALGAATIGTVLAITSVPASGAGTAAALARATVTRTVTHTATVTKTVTATATVTATVTQTVTASPPPTVTPTPTVTPVPDPPPNSSTPVQPPPTGWPDATSTGVPAGTTLTGYTGPCTISAANTVIDSKTLNCDLVVHAANLTVRNSKINGQVWLDQDLGHPEWSMTLTDTEVDAGATTVPAVCCGMYTLTRVNMHGGHNGAQCENGNQWCTITDSWIHGQYLGPNSSEHLGGFLSDGSDNITLTHNRIVCDHAVQNGEGCTGDINLIPNFAPVNGALIEANLLGANIGSSFCTYGGEKSVSPYPHSNHVVYRNNVFERGSNGQCAAYGPVTSFDINQPGNQWTNNTYPDGAVVNPAN